MRVLLTIETQTSRMAKKTNAHKLYWQGLGMNGEVKGPQVKKGLSTLLNGSAFILEHNAKNRREDQRE